MKRFGFFCLFMTLSMLPANTEAKTTGKAAEWSMNGSAIDARSSPMSCGTIDVNAPMGEAMKRSGE